MKKLTTILAALLLTACATTPTAAPSRPAVEHIPLDPAFLAAVRARGAIAPLSAAVRVDNVLYISGQIGTTPQGALAQGLEAQSRQTMDNVAAILSRAGLSWRDVFKCTVMLENMSDWPAFNVIYAGYFEGGSYPARSALGADGLALGALVEVECLAHVPAE